MTFEIGQSYSFEGMEPQQIRDDFVNYVQNYFLDEASLEELAICLGNYIDTDTLGQFMDDKMMGRQ
tara:strand:- start:825 stop:1022 length:198 start_codon:yes stop_codon:yes gene_type:complete